MSRPRKDKPGPRPRRSGGLRIPSADKIRELQTEEALNAANRVELLQRTKSVMLRIYKNDLEKLRKIGKGNYRRGFYRMMELAADVWIQHDEFLELEKIGKGNARVGFLTLLLEHQQKELDEKRKQE